MKLLNVCSLLLLSFTLVGCGININESLIDLPSDTAGSFGPSGAVEVEVELTICEQNNNATTYNEVGAGTLDDPYLICTLEQFISITQNSSSWSAHYKLMTDIDLTDYTEVADGTQYIPIGNASNRFSGSFDGNFKTISNLTYTDAASNELGVFGDIRSYRGFIKNLNLDNINITGQNNVGAIAGKASYTTVFNISITNSTITGSTGVGGAVGYATAGTFGTLLSEAAVVTTGTGFAGGLFGLLNTGSNVFNSAARGNISGAGYLGGMAGQLTESQVTSSYASGDVNSSARGAGGIVGWCHHCTLNNNFVTGNVAGDHTDSIVGPIIGYGGSNSSGSGNYYNSDSTYVNNGSGSTNAFRVGGSHDLSINPNAFFDSSNAPLTNWDFSNIWSESDGGTSLPIALGPELDMEVWRSCTDHISDTPFAGGIGNVSNPYRLCTADQIEAIDDSSTTMSNVVYKVMGDIDLTGTTVRIGSSSSFTGVFDGQGYEISNSLLNYPSLDSVGFFRSIGSSGNVHNVNLVDVNITGRDDVGGLSGVNFRGMIYNSSVTGVVTGNDNVGGVNGRSYGCAYNILFSNVAVSGNDDVGGIVGDGIISGTIYNAVAVGTVSVTASNSGGPIVGAGVGAVSSAYFDSFSACTNCDNTAGTGVDSNVSTTYFYDSASAAFSSWDFNNSWVESSSDYPAHK